MLAFESYRDVIRLACLGLNEAQVRRRWLLTLATLCYKHVMIVKHMDNVTVPLHCAAGAASAHPAAGQSTMPQQRLRAALPAPPAQGIAHAQEENVVLRAQAKAAAQAAALANLGKAGGGGAGPPHGAAGAGVPAGTGAFAAVGFRYDDGEEEGSEEEGGSDDGESEDDEDDDAPGTAGGSLLKRILQCVVFTLDGRAQWGDVKCMGVCLRVLPCPTLAQSTTHSCAAHGHPTAPPTPPHSTPHRSVHALPPVNMTP